MASQVKAIDTFKTAMLGCVELEKTKRGLGAMFHSAVIDLLNENPGMTGDELSVVFVDTMTEVENTLRSELVEAFGEDFDLREAMPSWTQYKSDYKVALTKVHRSDLIKCKGVRDVKKAKDAVNAAMKEKADGTSNTDSPADNGGTDNAAGGKAVDQPGADKLPPKVRSVMQSALEAMSRMDEATALEVAESFKKSAWARARNANPKLAAVTSGGTDKKAANA